MSKLYTLDFETNNYEYDCRVWAWGSCTIDKNRKFEYGNTIKGFFKWVSEHSPLTGYFHNLRFDGEFIISYLLCEKYKWTDKRIPHYGEFTTLISDKRIMYQIKVGLKNSKGKTVIATFNDSMKIYNFSVAKLAKDYKLSEQKGEIDYNLYREYGHILTDEEIDYLRRDVDIMAQLMCSFFTQGFSKMTIGSNAMDFYQKQQGKNYNRLFGYQYPDEELRPAYNGGWVYLKPEYKDRIIGGGIVLDVNSLFPSRMKYELMPYGMPLKYQGKYTEDKDYPLYVQKITLTFDIKKNHLPTIQLRKFGSFQTAQYATSSKGKRVTLMLSNVDLQLLFDHYNVQSVEYEYGYKFHGKYGMFDSYIDYWMAKKIEGEQEGNVSKRNTAKLFLNGFYGKFGTNTQVGSLKPTLQNGIVKYEKLPMETRDPYYLPVAIFTTAYARNYTVRAAQKNFGRFIYGDTDSLHLIGMEMPDLDIDPKRLGAWKHESTFTRANFLRAKCYMEEVDGKLIIKAAGLPDKEKQKLNFDNFHIGYKTDTKLRRKVVKGGVILTQTKYQIKE